MVPPMCAKEPLRARMSPACQGAAEGDSHQPKEEEQLP